MIKVSFLLATSLCVYVATVSAKGASGGGHGGGSHGGTHGGGGGGSGGNLHLSKAAQVAITVVVIGESSLTLDTPLR